MSVLNRIRAYRERKAYEKEVLSRQHIWPHGLMYSQLVAYQRSVENGKSNGVNSRQLEAALLMKEKAREIFMSHPAASAEDFERCWPMIRDQLFVRRTLDVLEGGLLS